MITNPTATALSAATTFTGTPTKAQLAANSFAVIYNVNDQPTFVAEIDTGAFVGTLTFYGLEVNGTELVPISGHLRSSSTVANNTAINTAVALNQVWAGSIASFQAFYVVCTAFTSGSVSVQPGISAALYAVSISNALNAAVTNGNANGQNTSVNSQPVVLPSDQTAIPVKNNKLSVLNDSKSAATSYDSGDLDFSACKVIVIDIAITANPAGTNPTIQFKLQRKDLAGNYHDLYFFDLITGLPANPTKQNVSIGPGTNWPEALGKAGKIVAVYGGTASPSYTFTVSAQGEN